MKNSDRIYLSLYYILKFFVTFMPECILHFLALIVARITFYLNKKHRKIIDTNLQICFPQYTQKERDKLSLKIYENFAQFGIDCLQNQNTTKEKILNKVNFINENLLIDALALNVLLFALVEGLGSFYIDQGFKANLVRFVINSLYKLSFKFAHQFIFVNESNAEFMRNLGLKENKICVIKSVGINLKKFFPIYVESEKKELFWKNLNIDKKPIVLMIARALWHKGVKEFYESATMLKDKANFVLVGGRDENPSCASLEFLNSGAVHYLGARSDIVELLQNCDIFVLPSYKEGFPVSVLEAKACGKAIVVSDCEGCVEAISNAYDGLWAKTKNAKDLSEKISLLLEDEKLRLNLAKNAAQDALQYDENNIAQRYLKLYDRVIKNV